MIRAILLSIILLTVFALSSCGSGSRTSVAVNSAGVQNTSTQSKGDTVTSKQSEPPTPDSADMQSKYKDIFAGTEHITSYYINPNAYGAFIENPSISSLESSNDVIVQIFRKSNRTGDIESAVISPNHIGGAIIGSPNYSVNELPSGMIGVGFSDLAIYTEFVDFVSVQNLQSYLSENNIYAKINYSAVVKCGVDGFPPFIWISSDNGSYFITINEDGQSFEGGYNYQYKPYDYSDFAKKYPYSTIANRPLETPFANGTIATPK